MSRVKIAEMREKKCARTKWLTLRLNEEEEKKLYKFYEKTTCRAISEYARNVLLQRPIHVRYRNQTADDFLAEMILLKKELNAIGNNFDQAVHKLHTLDHYQHIKAWAILNESHKQVFLKKVEEIQQKLSEIYELWSQK